MIFSTPISSSLTKKVARTARASLGRAEFRSFADGERYARILSDVRGRSVVALGSTPPPAENWIDLLFLIRALKENGARKVTAVIPYLGYGRGDHTEKRGEFVPLRLAADLLETAGASRIVVVDPHAADISGFFRIPVRAVSVLDKLLSRLKASRDTLIVAPDRGAAGRARQAARILGAGRVVVFRKVRPRPNVVRLLPGAKIRGAKSAIIVDDMIDTGGTVIAAVKRLRAAGIRDISVVSTHPLFSNDAAWRISRAGAARIIVADTIPLKGKKCPKHLRVATVADPVANLL